MKEMENKVVLITGGVKGLGKAFAERLAMGGAAVWVTSRTAEADAPVKKANPGEVKRLKLDVTNEESVKKAFAQVVSAHGKIDVLINNAGIGVFKPVLETTLTEWEDVFRTNMTGLFLCSKEAFHYMKDQGGGRIINISSVSGYIPIKENGAYGASKYAVRGFSNILNEEGKDFNIRVSVICPGMVYTDISMDRSEFKREDMLNAEDVAESVFDIAKRPLHVRIDEVHILPPKGVL